VSCLDCGMADLPVDVGGRCRYCRLLALNPPRVMERRRKMPFLSVVVAIVMALAAIAVPSRVSTGPDMFRVGSGNRPARCGPPITISSGGTYAGCYESTDPDVPAVTITTTAAVTLSWATIRHKGRGISSVVRSNATVQDSTFTALNPGSPEQQEAIYLYTPASATIDNNRFTDGHAILINGDNLSTSPLQIRRNDFIDVGRYDQPVCCLGAIHTDKVLAPGGSISWNRVTQTNGQSLTEDTIGIYLSNGASGNPLTVDHNLINGGYPLTAGTGSYFGAGINLGDQGGSWQVGDSNTVVNAANNGISVNSGENIIHTNSTVVSDGRAGINDAGPTVSTTFGNGFASSNTGPGPAPSNITITNNASGFRRWNGTAFEAADYYIPEADVATGNSSISPVNAAAEQAAVDAWGAARVAAGVTVGPRS
jgi:hypothetical protein